MMKRSISSDEVPATVNDGKMKKLKSVVASEEVLVVADKAESVLLDENLLYEVLKYTDGRTLGSAACVNKQWHKTAQDERLWELICTKHWANTGCSTQQLRSVVLALGGFRRLHSMYLLPLSKPSSSSSSTSSPARSTSNWPCLPPPPIVPAKPAAAGKTRWGKDEVQLSLSLLSIRYYEKMNFSNRGK